MQALIDGLQCYVRRWQELVLSIPFLPTPSLEVMKKSDAKRESMLIYIASNIATFDIELRRCLSDDENVCILQHKV